MVDERDKLHFRISIEMVLKDLRKEKGIAQGNKKGLSQHVVNADFANNFGTTLNMGRIESDPNFTIENLLIICDYFDIPISDFFRRVEQKEEMEIKAFLKRKVRKRKQKEQAKKTKDEEENAAKD